ncbi:MAG TPA: methyltransferase domain-containing protein [Candidatus Paceibacterota bacterium]|nr:methyltransferase domain-containing protein [Candidatus Paceibacterota bacterium]
MIRSLNLEQLGARLESVDELLLILMAHRMALSLDVGAYKRATDQPIFRREKEGERLLRVQKLAEKIGLNPNFAAAVLYNIIGESCKQQMIQLQGIYNPPYDTQDEEEWYQILKQNLLQLTERIAPVYDEQYGSEFFASRAYRDFENLMLEQEVDMLNDAELFVDLGCATGAQTFRLADKFKRSVGYDLSGHMVENASRKLDHRWLQRVRFQEVDLEDGIPLQNDSASFVMMNLGTASDIWNIRDLIGEAQRVLRKGGRFFFSFYNLDALVYQWDFLPWPVNLAAGINNQKSCLDVRVGAEIFSVYAKPYSVEQAEDFFPAGMKINRRMTYPTVSPLLPNYLFSTERARDAVLQVDRQLASSESGAYVIVTGAKEGAA